MAPRRIRKQPKQPADHDASQPPPESLEHAAQPPPPPPPTLGQPAAQPPQPPPKTYVVTVATDASLLDVYLRSAELHGLPEPVVLGAGEPWRGPTLYERFCGGFKWVLLRRWLKTVPNNAIVVFTDAYDVFWNAPLPSNLLDDGVDVLFAGEPTCWPDPHLPSSWSSSRTIEISADAPSTPHLGKRWASLAARICAVHLHLCCVWGSAIAAPAVAD